MADQSDVEQVLAAIVSGVLYPLGCASASATGVTCIVHRGWPVAATLDADLLAGRVTVTVAGETNGQRTTTRYPDEWRALRTVPVTLALGVAGAVVTVSGIAGPGQLAGLKVGTLGAVHRTVAGDTPQTVAAALGNALACLHGVSVSGAAITLPPGVAVIARVEADQPSVRETRRQLQAFRVVCWCPDPATRDTVAGLIDQALSTYDFLGLPDGMAGRIRFLGTSSSDRAEDAALYRRDLIYSVDYATTIEAPLPRMIFGDTRVAGDGVLVATRLS
jgi:hypothetical protein